MTVRFDYIITEKNSSRPSVAVNVLNTEGISDQDDTAFRRALLQTLTYQGILFSREVTRAFEDLILSKEPETYVARDVNTRELLSAVAKDPKNLDRPEMYPALIYRWLELLVTDGNKAIPPKLKGQLTGLASAFVDGELWSEEEAEVYSR